MMNQFYLKEATFILNQRGVLSRTHLMRKFKITDQYARKILKTLSSERLRFKFIKDCLEIKKKLYRKNIHHEGIMVMIIDGQEEFICIRLEKETRSIFLEYCGGCKQFSVNLNIKEASEMKMLLDRVCLKLI